MLVRETGDKAFFMGIVSFDIAILVSGENMKPAPALAIRVEESGEALRSRLVHILFTRNLGHYYIMQKIFWASKRTLYATVEGS